MPAQFFQATDDKPNGTTASQRAFLTFIRKNLIQLSPAITDQADLDAAFGEIWDAMGGNIPTLRADITGPLNAQASDLEVALITMFVLVEKFRQYGATLPSGGGP